MIGIVDYGAGNLASVANALDRLGRRWRTCVAPPDLAGADRLILPGVGHFGAAAARLAASGVGEALRGAVDRGVPLLGICLGLHLLFERSAEAPGVSGLGILPGEVAALEARRVPHMGWNLVTPRRAAGAVAPRAPEHMYFAHGFVAAPAHDRQVLASVKLDGRDWPAMVGRGRVVAVQFHPERSGPAGLALLGRFASW